MTVLPWWIAGGALGSLAVAHWILDRRPLGVSGVVARFANLRAELRAERDAAEAAAVAAALTAATAEAIDAGELTATPAAHGRGAATEGAASRRRRTLAAPVRIADHAAFLAALAAGGLAAGAAGESVDPLSGIAGAAGPGALAVLALGGALVGFGSAWMGGCTMGHGITGCARGMPGSLVATAVFVGTGVAASLALAVLPW